MFQFMLGHSTNATYHINYKVNFFSTEAAKMQKGFVSRCGLELKQLE